MELYAYTEGIFSSGTQTAQENQTKTAEKERKALTLPMGRNVSWSMDFMHDTLMNGRRFRTLNIIDDYNRQALSIEADFSFPSIAIVRALERVIHEHGKPQQIRTDNRPEFICTALTDWCTSNNIRLQYIQPGKPMQNGFIGRFNRTFRQDILDAFLFEDLYEIRNDTEQ